MKENAIAVDSTTRTLQWISKKLLKKIYVPLKSARTSVFGPSRADVLQEKLNRIASHLEELEAEQARQKKQLPIFDYEDETLTKFLEKLAHCHRGPQESITRKLSVYLPYIEKIKETIKHEACLDLACGRGEWLELMTAQGFSTHGVESSAKMVSICQEKGLGVTKGDLYEFLCNQPDSSWGIVTGFHIVEHINHTMLMATIKEAYRVLAPGGIVIFETPNPENIIVSSCNFYLDPTHLRPIPPGLLDFMVLFFGFYRTEVVRMSAQKRVYQDPIDKLFYGPEDYAIIGYKLPT